MVRALVAIAESSVGYSGIDLDFEQFAVDPARDGAAADTAAALYPRLVAQACSALHAIGRTCSVTVMPRTDAAHVYWRGPSPPGCTTTARSPAPPTASRSWPTTSTPPERTAGPVSPYGWVQAIIAYARATMPTDRTVLALPAYGYDWSGSTATAITAGGAPALAAAHGVKPRVEPGTS